MDLYAAIPHFFLFLAYQHKPQYSIPIFETQVKHWNVFQDHSIDFRHFSIPAERGITFRIWHFLQHSSQGPGSLGSSSRLELGSARRRVKRSEEPDWRLEAIASLWVTSHPSTALGEAAVPGSRCLPAGALARHDGSADWQELASLGWRLTNRPSAVALEEPAAKHCPAWCGPLPWCNAYWHCGAGCLFQMLLFG